MKRYKKTGILIILSIEYLIIFKFQTQQKAYANSDAVKDEVDWDKQLARYRFFTLQSFTEKQQN